MPITAKWWLNILGTEELLHYLDRLAEYERNGHTLTVREAWKRHQAQMWLAAHYGWTRHNCMCAWCCELRQVYWDTTAEGEQLTLHSVITRPPSREPIPEV